LTIKLPAYDSNGFLKAAEASRDDLRERHSVETILVESAQLQAVLATARQLAGTEATVLIQGENGTGKAVIAKAIHAWSQRATYPFITIDCTTLPETLMESELFGHERGAFTGALTVKRGLFEAGDGGTIFLDEVAEMTLAAQAKLLRVLQEQIIRRVGGTTSIQIDVRIVAATNKDLKTLVHKRAFREDLYFRLNGIVLTVPPLRERREDIAALAHHFINVYSHRAGRTVQGISPEAMQILLYHAWPGNVRELQNAMERAVLLGHSGLIVPEDLPPSLLGHDDFTSTPPPGQPTLEEMERSYILFALSEHGRNQTKVAAALGISRTTLWRKLKKYFIEL
jgi:transcriptional regulator with PAS, ATPase and Fis domain